MTNEGKIGQLIKEKRIFLRQSTRDYSTGGNDMLDDVEGLVEEARAELIHQLEVAACIREEEGDATWHKECHSIYTHWFEKWFGGGI